MLVVQEAELVELQLEQGKRAARVSRKRAMAQAQGARGADDSEAEAHLQEADNKVKTKERVIKGLRDSIP